MHCCRLSLIHIYVFLAVILFLDYHGAGGKVSHSLAVFGQKDDQKSQTTGHRSVDREEKPSEQVLSLIHI